MKMLDHEGLRAKGIPQGKTQLWRMVRDKTFPAPAKIGQRLVWSEDEIDAYLRERLAARGEVADGRPSPGK